LVAALLVTSRSGLASDSFEIQVYDATANQPGQAGLELHLNAWPTGHAVSDPPLLPLRGQWHATLEPSLGLTPYWEIGGYLEGAVLSGGQVDWAGAKLRTKFVTPPGYFRHLRLGLNVEVSYAPAAFDPDRWASELRPMIVWQDDAWLLAVNPILDQPLAGSAAEKGPSFEPACKAARTLGPVAAGFEYYADLGPLSDPHPWREQEHYLFAVIDLLSVPRLEVNAGIGEGLTAASAGTIVKVILGYELEAPGAGSRPVSLAPAGRRLW
jgi:hypothetical protein